MSVIIMAREKKGLPLINGHPKGIDMRAAVWLVDVHTSALLAPRLLPILLWSFRGCDDKWWARLDCPRLVR